MNSRVREPSSENRVESLALDDELRDLEIDGYKVVFTKKVSLMPVELTDVRPTKSDSSE